MELRMNFRVDEPTVNGRIYPRAVMEKALAEFEGKPFFVKNNVSMGVDDFLNVKLSEVSAEVLSHKITDDGEIIFNIKPFDTEEGKKLIKLFETFKDTLTLTTCGIGVVKNDKVIQDDFQLSYIGLAFDEIKDE